MTETMRHTGEHCENCDQQIAMGEPVIVAEVDWLTGPIAYAHLGCTWEVDTDDREGER